MEIKGKIILALPEVVGTSKAGNPWKKKEYVLETQESFPRKVHFDFFGDKADQYNLAVGDVITLSFDIESREYNGKWFTSIRGWKAEKDGVASAPVAVSAPVPEFGGAPVPPAPQNFGGNETDDLPF